MRVRVVRQCFQGVGPATRNVPPEKLDLAETNQGLGQVARVGATPARRERIAKHEVGLRQFARIYQRLSSCQQPSVRARGGGHLTVFTARRGAAHPALTDFNGSLWWEEPVGRVRAAAAAASAAAAGACAARGWEQLPPAKVVVLWIAVALVALAAMNLSRTVLPRGASAGPALFVVVAALLVFESIGGQWNPSWSLVIAALLAVATIVLLATGPDSPNRMWTIGWVRSRSFTGEIPETLTLGAAFAAAEVDLRQASPASARVELRCLMVGAHLTLWIPATWQVVIEPSSRALSTGIDDSDPISSAANVVMLRISLSSLASGVTLRRR